MSEICTLLTIIKNEPKMKNLLSLKYVVFPSWKVAISGIAVGTGLLLLAQAASAQTTNALDLASDAAYFNDGPPNGLSPGGQNGGSGFGAWSFTVNSSGGAFMSSTGPSGASFDLWNNSYNASTYAIRPFNSPLSAGQSFSVQLCLNSLDGTANTNMLAMEDASGHVLFSYYHLGGDNNNGHYTDATTSSGTAVNFPYDYQQFDTFTFTLNSATSYTFTDNKTGASVSGVISGGPITQVAFIRGNGQENPSSGQDFQFDTLQIVTTAGPPAPPGFANAIPTPGSFSVPATNGLSVQIVPGSASLSPSGVTFSIDGGVVTPAITSGSGGSLIVSYQPSSPFSSGSAHIAKVVVVDGNHNSFTNAWSFTVGFASLPATLPGPILCTNVPDIFIFTAGGDAWLGTNYGPSATKTLYARFSMNFNNLNGETGTGGGFGGLQMWNGSTGYLLVGNDGDP